DAVGIRLRKLQRVAATIAIGGIGVWLLAQGGLFQPSTSPKLYQQVHQIVTGETTTALLLILFTGAVLLLFSRNKISGMVLVIALGGLQFVDMNIFGFSQNNGETNPRDYYLQTAQTVGMLKQDGLRELFRVNARQGGAMVLDRNQGMVDQIFMLEGYTPLALQRSYPPAKDWDKMCDLLNAKYRISIDRQHRSMQLVTSSTHLPRAFLVYRDTIMLIEKEEKAYMESDAFNPAQEVVLEEDPHWTAEDRGDSTSPSTFFTSYRLNSMSLTVITPRNGFLVLSEIYYPGWSAYVDGSSRRIYRADWSLRAIPLEKGSHQVELRFEPESYRRGSWITIATIGFSIIGIVYFTRKKNRGGQTINMRS
ncbi:MAG: YfhO family protein, partial [Ignavibacteriales bacterium]|nr:YfhO family protein [Ignavibacteriales bacterium]